MKTRGPRVLGFVAAGGFALLSGCAAHRTAAVVDTDPPAVPVHPAAPVAEAPASTPSEKDDLTALLEGTVLHFDFNNHDLTPDSRDRLQKLGTALVRHPEAKIRISGNCDERGTEEYNLALGQQRAEVARKYLAALGVSNSRVETVSYGDERPSDARHEEAAWAANRRDEFSLQR